MATGAAGGDDAELGHGAGSEKESLKSALCLKIRRQGGEKHRLNSALRLKWMMAGWAATVMATGSHSFEVC
jgi:hypothetical protein